MTKFLLSLTGVHARNEETIRATQDWERKRIDSGTLKTAFRGDADSLVALQQDLDFDYISDGQFSPAWQDFLSPITRGVHGVRKGPLVRWYNTNTFYYTPIVRGEISTGGKAILKGVEKRYLADGSSFRIMLPDPLTFVDLADDRFYSNREKLLFAFADNVLNEEIRRLERAGIKYVQFSSPSLVARFRDEPIGADELAQVGEAIRSSLRGSSVRSGFHTFFGDSSPYIPAIFDAIPTDDVGFDFSQTDPSALSHTKKGIIAGVVDARSSYLEGIGEIERRALAASESSGSSTVTLGPSSDLRYIPRSVADEKLRRLSKLKQKLEEN